MAEGGNRLTGNRGPLLYGLVAIVVGVASAVIFGLTVGPGTSSVAASASPPTTAVRSASPSTIDGSPVLLPSQATSPLATASAPPTATAGPTPTPTTAPAATPKPTPKPTAKPTATPNTNPVFLSLAVPKTEDCTGGTAGTIHISWSIANATGVTLAIDGPGIFDSYQGTSRAVDVPFACSHQQLSHTYTFTTTGGSGPAATKTRTVTAAAPRIVSFTLAAPICPSASGSVGIAFGYEIAAATGVVLERDGAVQATYSGKARNGLTVVYDCTKSSQTFVLTTTGGYGPEATKQLVVQR